MSQNLSKPGGSKLWYTNQRADTADMNNIGTLAEQALWDGFVARIFEGTDGFIGDDCIPSKDAADLDYLVEAGMGLISLSGGAFEPDYTPVFVNAQQSGACNAHDAVHPRKDILTLAPLDVDDETSSEKILSGGVLVPQNKNTRRRRGFTLTYTAGTPAAMPVAPATPAGTLLVAIIDVPAITGAITVNDERSKLVVSTGILKQRVRADIVSIGVETSNHIDIIFQVVDVESGEDQTVEQHFLVRIHDKVPNLEDDPNNFTLDGLTYQVSASGSGTAILLKSDVIGVCGVRVQDMLPGYSGDVWVEIAPVSYYNGSAMAEGLGFPVMVKITFI